MYEYCANVKRQFTKNDVCCNYLLGEGEHKIGIERPWDEHCRHLKKRAVPCLFSCFTGCLHSQDLMLVNLDYLVCLADFTIGGQGASPKFKAMLFILALQ